MENTNNKRKTTNSRRLSNCRKRKPVSASSTICNEFLPTHLSLTVPRTHASLTIFRAIEMRCFESQKAVVSWTGDYIPSTSLDINCRPKVVSYEIFRTPRLFIFRAPRRRADDAQSADTSHKDVKRFKVFLRLPTYSRGPKTALSLNTFYQLIRVSLQNYFLKHLKNCKKLQV